MCEAWLNCEKYGGLQLALFLGGFTLWGWTYIFVIRNAVRNHFVEVPAFAVAANTSWEFLWGFVFSQDMGRLVTIMFMGGFLLDCVIVFFLFRYGEKQIASPTLRRRFKTWLVVSMLAWLPLYVGFHQTGLDLPAGMHSALIVTLMMSVLFLQLVANVDDPHLLSPVVAWLKMLGTLLLTSFCALAYPDDGFAIVLGVTTFALDILYVAALGRRRSHAGAHSAG